MIMATHRLKTLSPYFEALVDGSKPFEVRLNDRDYQVGDELLLEHWSTIDPRTDGELGLVPGSPTVRARITYVYEGRRDPVFGWDLVEPYVVLGLELFPRRYAQGIQVGSGNVQHNVFGAAPSDRYPGESDADLDYRLHP
jgi:hypothetical protein